MTRLTNMLKMKGLLLLGYILVMVFAQGCSAQELIRNGRFIRNSSLIIDENCRIVFPPNWIELSNTSLPQWRSVSGVDPESEVMPVFCRNCVDGLSAGDTIPTSTDVALVLNYSAKADWHGLHDYFVIGEIESSDASRTVKLKLGYSVLTTSGESSIDTIPFYVGFADHTSVHAAIDTENSPCYESGMFALDCVEIRHMDTILLSVGPSDGGMNVRQFDQTITVPAGVQWILLGDINKDLSPVQDPKRRYTVLVDRISLTH